MTGAVALVAGALATVPGAWPEVLSDLRVGGAVPPSVGRKATHVDADTRRGLERGLVDTGLLAVLNRVRGAPRDASGQLDPKQAWRTYFDGASRGRWAVLANERGRVVAARFEILVPVDTRGEGPRGWNPNRLHLRTDALRRLAAYRLVVTRRDRRGNARAWRGRHPGGQLDVWYWPERDQLEVLLWSGVAARASAMLDRAQP